MNNNQLLDLALRTPPVEWDDVANRWITGQPGKDWLPPVGFQSSDSDRNRGTMDDAIRQLDGMIQALVRFRAYLDERYGHGCGDQGHASAVQNQNTIVAKVRKAMGFSIPRNDVRF